MKCTTFKVKSEVLNEYTVAYATDGAARALEEVRLRQSNTAATQQGNMAVQHSQRFTLYFRSKMLFHSQFCFPGPCKPVDTRAHAFAGGQV